MSDAATAEATVRAARWLSAALNEAIDVEQIFTEIELMTHNEIKYTLYMALCMAGGVLRGTSAALQGLGVDAAAIATANFDAVVQSYLFGDQD